MPTKEPINAAGPEDQLRLGKKPARKGAISFQLRSFVDLRKLPKPPKSFGSYLGQYQNHDNDKYGDCVWAGAANETADWCRDVGSKCDFHTKDVLKAYSDVTGFNPRDPATDNGTDMGMAASYRRKKGLKDTLGRYHKIDAFARLPVGRADILKAAMFSLGGAGIGFLFPSYAWEQFDKGGPWATRRGRAELQGGHYVPALGWNAKGNIVCVSWGKIIEMTPGFYERFSDEAVVYLSLERLYNAKANALLAGQSPEGFKIEALRAHLAALG